MVGNKGHLAWLVLLVGGFCVSPCYASTRCGRGIPSTLRLVVPLTLERYPLRTASLIG
jgi:hypothetical protein